MHIIASSFACRALILVNDSRSCGQKIISSIVGFGLILMTCTRESNLLTPPTLRHRHISVSLHTQLVSLNAFMNTRTLTRISVRNEQKANLQKAEMLMGPIISNQFRILAPTRKMQTWAFQHKFTTMTTPRSLSCYLKDSKKTSMSKR
jgi:hypothetical protein